MISIMYLSRYYICDDLFKRIPASLDPVEYGAETDTSGDNVCDRKH